MKCHRCGSQKGYYESDGKKYCWHCDSLMKSTDGSPLSNIKPEYSHLMTYSDPDDPLLLMNYRPNNLLQTNNPKSDTPRTDSFLVENPPTGLQSSFQGLANFCRQLEREWNQRNKACDDYASTIYRQAEEIENLKKKCLCLNPHPSE